ncbi:MAG: hypothetical protein WAU65_03215 [Candidatus Nanoarchaeia archaeon]
MGKNLIQRVQEKIHKGALVLTAALALGSVGCGLSYSNQEKDPVALLNSSQLYGEASLQKPLQVLFQIAGTTANSSDRNLKLKQYHLYVIDQKTKQTLRDVTSQNPIKTIFQFTGADIVDVEGDVTDTNGNVGYASPLEEVVADIPVSTPVNPQPPTNQFPIISSNPVTIVNSGQNYNYQVVASDPENNPLTYSVIQTPTQWLSVNSSGLVTGSGQEVNSDTSSNVEIDVSNGTNTTKQDYTLLVKNSDLVCYFQFAANYVSGGKFTFSGQIENNTNPQIPVQLDNSNPSIPSLEYILFKENTSGQVNLESDKKKLDEKLNYDVIITLDENGWFNLAQESDDSLGITINNALVQYNGVDITNLLYPTGIYLKNHPAYVFDESGTYYLESTIKYNSTKTFTFVSNAFSVQ